MPTTRSASAAALNPSASFTPKVIAKTPSSRTKPPATAKRASKTPVLPPTPTLLFPDAAALEAWIATQDPLRSLGLWLKISKKGNSVPSVNYDQALDVALCHGWIDGQRKRSEVEGFFLQRFTPRRKGSLWSRRNVDKVSVLTADGRMRPGGIAQVEAAKADGRWERAYSSAGNLVVPEGLREGLREGDVEGVFDALGKGERFRIVFAYETQRTEAGRRRKLEETVGALRDGMV